MNTHACVCACADVYSHIWRPEFGSGAFLSHSPFMLLRQDLSLILDLADLATGVDQQSPSDLHVSISPAKMRNTCSLLLAFYVGSGSLNSGPHSCVPS